MQLYRVHMRTFGTKRTSKCWKKAARRSQDKMQGLFPQSLEKPQMCAYKHISLMYKKKPKTGKYKKAPKKNYRLWPGA